MELKNLVWIDDDIDIIDPLVRRLEKKKYKITKYYSPNEVRKNWEAVQKADLIILDMIMPSGKCTPGHYAGLELLEEMRGPKNINIPVLVLTVVLNEELFKKVYRLGVKDIINKPVRPSELEKHVENALS